MILKISGSFLPIASSGEKPVSVTAIGLSLLITPSALVVMTASPIE